jgi:hypothetical protein
MALLRQYLKQAMVESAIAERGGERLGPERQTLIEQEAQRALERVPWKQMETRLFDQGGWVHKDPKQRVMVVIFEPFDNPLMQRACELLCEHLTHLQPIVRYQDGDYALRYIMWDTPPG